MLYIAYGRHKVCVKSYNKRYVIIAIVSSLVSESVCLLEIAFILDSSESAGTVQFNKEKTFVKSFSEWVAKKKLHARHLKTRLALISYSSSVHINQHFKDWQDLNVFLDNLKRAEYIGHGTYSTYAISNATQLFTNETKEKSIRVALLMTDGIDHPQNPDIMRAFDEAKDNKIKIFTISLPNPAKNNVNSAKPQAVMSSPGHQFSHSLTDPKLEEQLQRQLVRHSVHLSALLDLARSHILTLHIINANKSLIKNRKGKTHTNNTI